MKDMSDLYPPEVLVWARLKLSEVVKTQVHDEVIVEQVGSIRNDIITHFSMHPKGMVNIHTFGDNGLCHVGAYHSLEEVSKYNFDTGSNYRIMYRDASHVMRDEIHYYSIRR